MIESQQQDTASGKVIETSRWAHVEDLVCILTVELPFPHFRIAQVLDLANGSIIRTDWQVGTDVPLRVNGKVVAWCEFEVVENRLAVRLTEVA